MTEPEYVVENTARDRLLDGAAFVLDAPDEVPALWGDGETVAWAKGEPLAIAGPQSVGKTTLAQRLMLARAGIRGRDVLGMNVERSDGRVLYIAADRPDQARRSLARMVGEDDRDALRNRLVFHKGPLPFDLGRAAPGALVEFVADVPEVGTVIVDSLKDVATKLANDETGARVNAEHQRLIAAGYELVILHHQRKSSADNRAPRRLDDVYGSTWITAGTGSVLLLWGNPGDPLVELRTLKPALGEVGPLTVSIDARTGEVGVHERPDLLALVHSSPGGVTAKEAAISVLGVDKPDAAQRERMRRKLEGYRRDGLVDRNGDGADREAVRYRGVKHA